MVPGLLYFLIFKYIPMANAVIAFKNYSVVLGIWGSPEGDVFAVGENGVIVQNVGFGWEVITGITNQKLRAVWGISSDNVFAVGNSGTVTFKPDSVITCLVFSFTLNDITTDSSVLLRLIMELSLLVIISSFFKSPY